MRFASLKVESFQTIRRAEVELVRGLNIVYGPNDLGKSTLVAALRAALLVVPSSAEADSFTSWYSGDSPRVELTFIDADERHWRIRKTFAASPSAELLHSKDGGEFTMDCRGREVEEKLRTMLAWGIPAPGGKGAPRGPVESFLSTVLLAGQTKTDSIFECSLAADRDQNAKVRLSRALAALAQDPLFKTVLAEAQAEVDLYFTPSGRYKHGRSSPFTSAREEVQKLDGELEQLRKQTEESQAIEHDLHAKREERSRVLERLNEVRARLAWAEAAGRLRASRQLLDEIDGEAERLRQMDQSVQSLEARLVDKDRELADAKEGCERAENALRAAEEAHRAATSEDFARDHEIRRMRIETRLSELAQRIGDAQRTKEHVDAAISAREAVKEARIALEEATREYERLAADATAGAAGAELARAIVAFVRWRQAVNANVGADRARSDAARAQSEAAARESEAAEVQAEIVAIEEERRRQSDRLPSSEQAAQVQRLARELDLAEAALGGGLTVLVRPAAGVIVRATADHREIIDVTESGEVVAERTVTLTIGDLAGIDILAGTAEKRQTVELLRRRWSDNAEPMFAAAGVTDLEELTKCREAIEALQLQLEKRRNDMRNLLASADGSRTQASLLESQAAAIRVTAEELELRREALGDHEPAALESHSAELGNPSEAEAEARCKTLVQKHTTLEKDAAAAKEALDRKQYEFESKQRQVEESNAGFDRSNLDTVAVAAADALRALSGEHAAAQAELASVRANASREVEAAAAALQETKRIRDDEEQRHAAAAAARQSAESELATAQGRREMMREALAKRDRDGAAQVVETRTRELESLSIDGTLAGSEDEARRDVQSAQREYDRAKEDLDRQEGMFSRAGGKVLQEDIERLRQARDAAKARERDMEIDADAWKLLRDTLRAVENEEGVHLGRALAGPVAARLSDLTAGRYQGLRMDAALKTEKLEAAGVDTPGDVVLDTLSVGTRDQLAALIRLAIADQLKSAIVLDDHLVHSDRTRLLWFRDVLQRTAVNAQVIVLTCRAEDYLAGDESPADAPVRDFPERCVRTIDASRVIARYP
jgi:DNA repair exonuclease SbcCD ATPase subunit